MIKSLQQSIMAGFLLITCCLSANAQKTKQPNIIVILSDDQGWGATSVQMDKRNPQSASDFMQTPNLEKLAESGIRFSNGYAGHPNCSPSRAALQTGMSPARLHYTDILGRDGGDKGAQFRLIEPPNVTAIPDSARTIAELIKQNRPEYATAHFGKWHIDKKGPAMHGYDESDGPTGNNNGNSKIKDDPKAIFSVTQRSTEWMEKQVKSGKPFFMQVSHYAVHEGIQAREETKAKYKNLPAGKRHNHIAYAAMTDDLDKGVGLLLDKVKELGIDDNTYIIYMADNGAVPGLNPQNTNGPLRGTKATVWEGGIRTPFIISGPGITANKQSDVRIVSWDIFPTICDWLSIKKLPKYIDGGSIAPLLKNEGAGKEIHRANDFLVFYWPRYVPDKGSSPSVCILKDDYKLVYSYETNEKFLFNIKNDLGEQNPLNEKYPQKVDELYMLMSNYLKSVNAALPVANPAFDVTKNILNKKTHKKGN